MKYIYKTLIGKKESKTEVEITAKHIYDVIVVGIGTAGVYAFLTCAEENLDVLGIEALSGMGGVGVNGAVYDYFYGSTGGSFEAVDKTCIDMMNNGGYTRCFQKNEADSYRGYPPAARERIWDKMTKNKPIEYNSRVCGVYMNDNSICGVRYIKNSKQQDAFARVIIDCSGNNTVSRLASFPVKNGRTADGKMMNWSKTVGRLEDSLLRGVWTFNTDMSNDLFHISKEAARLMTVEPYLIESYSDRMRVAFPTPMISFRESSVAETEESVDFSKFTRGICVESPIFYAYTPLDNVSADLAYESKAQVDWSYLCALVSYGFRIAVSMKCLMSKGASNLLIASKGLGIDRDLATGLRMKKDLQKFGEVSALIASQAISENKSVKEINYEELKKKLIKRGIFKESDTQGIGKVYGGGTFESVELLKCVDEIKSGLSCESSGIAFFTVKFHYNDEIKNALLSWISSDDTVLRENSILCLGMMQEKSVRLLLIKLFLESENEINRKKAYYALSDYADENDFPLFYDSFQKYAVYVSQNDSVREFMHQTEFRLCTFALRYFALLSNLRTLSDDMKSKIREVVKRDGFNKDSSLYKMLLKII